MLGELAAVKENIICVDMALKPNKQIVHVYINFILRAVRIVLLLALYCYYCLFCKLLDGGWSSWSSWTPCTNKCGYGIKTQSRTCTNPTPSPHGNDCVGNSMRVDTCFVITDTSKYADCSEVKAHCESASDGIYHVTLWNTKRKIQVYCDMTTNGGGWTVFQYRYNGKVDFYRNFAEYVKGFGDLRTEFWLGLDYVEEISSQYKSQLRVDLISANGTTAFEVFDKFSLGASPEYTLHVGSTLSSHNIGSSGSFGPYHKDMPFSTYDNDVDKSSRNCASTYHGAWWYNKCHYVNLNGKYLIPGDIDDKGINYYSFLGRSSLKETRISFRRSPT
ncbi:Fibrinogen C domain-containing protein 1 [Mactra antiquata]